MEVGLWRGGLGVGLRGKRGVVGVGGGGAVFAGLLWCAVRFAHRNFLGVDIAHKIAPTPFLVLLNHQNPV